MFKWTLYIFDNLNIILVIKGRPWHTYEGFTIIIREQVKALIKLGASPLLKVCNKQNVDSVTAG